MQLSLFLEQLTHNTSGLPEVDQIYCKTHSISTQAQKLPFYVEPDLSGSSDLQPIVLVSAPAAVGKTTLAHYLHSELEARGQGVLYVPLQSATIGNDFFSGRLAGVFPEMGKRDFLDAVFSGQIIILFDGYDEVTMRTEQLERNKQFIEEILTELEAFEGRGGRPKPSILFLFRSVFAEFGVFDSASYRSSSITVRFFDQTRRKRFLSRYLDQLAENEGRSQKSKGHLASEFLDGFENTLSRARDEAAAFFGHAIVLSAFGDFLHEQPEDNAARLSRLLTEDETVEKTAVDLLSKIISKILERETTKFPIQDYRSSLPEFDPYPISLQESLLCALAEDDVYNRAGQPSNKALEACIQEASSRIEKAPGFDKLVPAERQGLRARYLEELRNKINQHPFVDLKEAAKIGFRNPVYREYYLAGRVAQDSSTDWGILARASDASHYLALFFLHHIEDRDLARYQGFLFHFISLLATSSSGDNFLFKLEWSPSHTRWEGTVECPDLQVDQFFFGDQVLIVELPLQATLQNVVLSGGKECMVELSGPGPEHAFSDPVVLRDCVIQAGEVSLNAAALRFDGLTVTTRLLQLDDKVARLEGLDSLLVQGLTDEDPLLECSEYARGQWGDGIVSKVQTNEQGKALFQSKLAKMLRWFRRHGRPEYACYDKKFQTCALNGKQDQNAVLLAEFLIDKGLLNRRESLIVMDQDAFASYGVSYKKQNEIDFGEKFESLYDCLVRSQYGASYA